MEALSALQGLLDAPVQLTVNGTPLGTALHSIAAAVQEQAAQLQALQAYSYSTHTEQWDRIVALEHSVARMSNDLAVDQRPLVGGHQSAAHALASLEQRLRALETHKQCTRAAELQGFAEKVVTKRYFAKLSIFVAFRSAARAMGVGTAHEVRRRYFRKLRQFVALRTQSQRRSRALRAIGYNASKALFSRYFATWHRHHLVIAQKQQLRHEYNIECANEMAAVVLRGLVRRFYLRWHESGIQLRRREAQLETVFGMHRIVCQALVRRYFSAWVVREGATRRRRHQLQAIDVLASRSGFNLAHMTLHRWIAAAQRRIRRRRVATVVVPRLRHHQSMRLALRYFGRLQRNMYCAEDRRREQEAARRVNALQARCDALANQLDAGLRAIQRTNAVVMHLATAAAATTTSAEADRPAAGGGGGGGVGASLAEQLLQAAQELDQTSAGAPPPQPRSAAQLAGATSTTVRSKAVAGGASWQPWPQSVGGGRDALHEREEDSSDEETERRLAALMAKAHLVAQGAAPRW